MKAYYKKSDGKVVDLEQQNILNLYFADIVELVIPDGCKDVSCWGNQLTELNIPDGCKYVNCHNNQLKELIIPNSCESVSCRGNQLKELIIPNNCKNVWADMKSVTEINKVEYLRLCI